MSINHATQLNKMLESKKIKQRFIQVQFSYDDCIKYVAENKSPVLVGTMETSAGHIVVFDGQFQNPYGNPNRTIHTGSCKYDSVQGANLEYPKDFAINMVFREMRNKKTSQINVKRPCWVIK